MTPPRRRLTVVVALAASSLLLLANGASAANGAAPKCDSAAGFGTLTEQLFDAYADAFCEGKAHCVRPTYSSVANKCVKCTDYLGEDAIASDAGECEPRVAVLDTKLSVWNAMNDPGTGDWNPSWLIVNMGTCTFGCNVDPNYVQPRTLKPGQGTSQQGWNGLSSGDVVADVTFCKSWQRFEYKCSERDLVRIQSGNPTIGTPWISIGGDKRTLRQGDYWETWVNGHKFSAKRNKDMTGAKDMIVTVLE